jgi:OFA family oxalate/formate antiporter-like MFS transporter
VRASAPAPRAAFRGWHMVAVAFLVDFIAVGFFFYSFGIYYPAIDADLEGSSVWVAAGISVSNVVSGLFAPFIGRALDRHELKHVMLLGALIVSAGFLCLSRVTAYWQYYLVLGSFFAFGLGMMGGLASAKLVANWFAVKRGTALGVASMGVSLSGVVMPTLATWLVAELGWRGGFVVYSVGILLIVVPLVSFFVVTRPEDVGQHLDGDGGEDWSRSDAAPEVFWRTRDILRARNFWFIALPFAAVFSSLSAILIHVVPYAGDLGITGYRAGWVLSVSAGAGVLGKLVFGRLVDRWDPRFVVWTSFGTQILGLWLLLRGAGYGGLVVGAVVFGFGMGGVVPLQGALAGLAFGRLSFGEVMGLMRPVQVPLHALGIPLAAWIHDTTGSFVLAFQIFLGVYVASCALIALLELPGPSPSGREARLA